MDQTSKDFRGAWVVALMGLTFVVTAIATASAIGKHYQSEAVKAGCAEYDSQTGKWRWKAPTGKSQ